MCLSIEQPSPISTNRLIMRIHKYLLVFSLFILLPSTVKSQESSSIDVHATVLEVLTVIGMNDMEFGNITAGNTFGTAPDEPEAGSFMVSGEAGAEVDVSFTLPPVLNHVSSPLTIEITFRSDDGVANTSDDAAGGQAFDPNVGTTRLLDGSFGELYLFLGGELSPAVNQEPGDYEGTITVTVDYTGN